MRICVIARQYPSPGNPKHVFLEKIVKEFIDQGNECMVIAPQTKRRSGYVRPLVAEYSTDNDNKYIVYSPVYKNLSGRKIGFINLAKITQNSFTQAVDKTYTENELNCDVFYSHFLPAGVTANYMSCKYGKPFYMANGESDLSNFIHTLDSRDVRDTYKNVSAIISVSTANKQETLNCGLFDEKNENIIYVLPNAINPEVFHAVDKSFARRTIGIDEDKFVISFVGQFCHRKGPLRVTEALKQCDDVWSIFIGSGEENPQHDKCLFKGRVENDKVSLYLSASDVFVLPTLNEGCCNAIIEAVACGIPVISSDLPFNYDILDKNCAILIDPNDIDSIREAILFLKENPEKRVALKEGALKKMAGFSLSERARKILQIMNNEK